METMKGQGNGAQSGGIKKKKPVSAIIIIFSKLLRSLAKCFAFLRDTFALSCKQDVKNFLPHTVSQTMQ